MSCNAKKGTLVENYTLYFLLFILLTPKIIYCDMVTVPITIRKTCIMCSLLN